jgi:hypothetical protein
LIQLRIRQQILADRLSGITYTAVGYEEEGEWVAHSLEMDLQGFGATFELALEELKELVALQISFAWFKRQPELIWKQSELRGLI